MVRWRRTRRQGVEWSDPELKALSSRVLAGARGERNVGLPDLELCLVAVRLAAALTAVERTGGARADAVLARRDFAGALARDESSFGLPRPNGRWELVLRRGDDVERVIGHAGGGWTVEGLDRVAGPLRDHGSVLVDGAGPERALEPPPVTPAWNPDAGARGAGATRGDDVGVALVALGAWAAAYAASERPPRWHRDPTERHDLRLWDGQRWTRFVIDLRADDR